MKYIIQVFRQSDPESNVGKWDNTAWGNDDYEKAKSTCESIIKANKMGITRVRIVEVLFEVKR